MVVYRFANCVLDAGRRELICAGTVVVLQPKTFELLIHLVEHADRVVRRDSLLDAVWAGSVVTDAALTQAVSQARRALGAAAPRLRTIARVGYIFDGPVERLAAEDDAPPLIASAGDVASVAPAGSQAKGAASAPTDAELKPDGKAISDSGAGNPASPRRAYGNLRVPRSLAALPTLAFAALFAAGALGLLWALLPTRTEPRIDLLPSDAQLHGSDLASGLFHLLAVERHADPRIYVRYGLVTADNDGHASLRFSLAEPEPARRGELGIRWTLRQPDGATQAWTDWLVLDRLDQIGVRLDRSLAERLDGWQPASPAAIAVPLSDGALLAFAEGMAARARHDHNRARGALERSVAAAPRFAIARHALSQTLDELGHRELAVSHARQALATLAPDAADTALMLRAHLHGLLHEHARAAGFYGQLAALQPARVEWRLRRADALVRSGDAAAARAELASLDRAALTLADRLSLHKTEARALMGEGHHASAERALAGALALPGTDALPALVGDLHLLRGEALGREQRHAEARQAADLAAGAYTSAKIPAGVLEAALQRTASALAEDRQPAAGELDALDSRARSLGNVNLEIAALNLQAMAAAGQHAPERARERQLVVVELAERFGHPLARQIAMFNAALLSSRLGDAAMLADLLQGLSTATDAGAIEGWARAYLAGDLALLRGDYVGAHEHFQRMLQLSQGEQTFDDDGRHCYLGEALLGQQAWVRAATAFSACASENSAAGAPVTESAARRLLAAAGFAYARWRSGAADSGAADFAAAFAQWRADAAWESVYARTRLVAWASAAGVTDPTRLHRQQLEADPAWRSSPRLRAMLAQADAGRGVHEEGSATVAR